MEVVVLKHHGEPKKKCSILPLEGRQGLEFVNYADFDNYDFSGLTLLHPAGKIIDKIKPDEKILLFDGGWKKARAAYNRLADKYSLKRVGIESWQTVYPWKAFKNHPHNSLASVEALFITYLMAGTYDESLLNNYYWKAEFLETNNEKIETYFNKQTQK